MRKQRKPRVAISGAKKHVKRVKRQNKKTQGVSNDAIEWPTKLVAAAMEIYEGIGLGVAADTFQTAMRKYLHRFDDTRIVTPLTGAIGHSTHAAVVAHMRARVPLFLSGSYHWASIAQRGYDALRSLTGQRIPPYKTKAAMPPLPFHRYGVLGSTYAVLEGREMLMRTMWYIHIWAVNFEGMGKFFPESELVNNTLQTNAARVAYVEAIMQENASIVAKSVVHITKQKRGNRSIHVHAPVMGAGAYINHAPNGVRKVIKERFGPILLEQLRTASALIPTTTLVVTLPHYRPPAIDTTSIVKLLAGKVLCTSKVKGTADPTPGTMRLLLEQDDTINEHAATLALNAWDSNSYIGNGLDIDNTLDGWTTTNPHTFKDKQIDFTYLSNSSFAHNSAVLNPEGTPII